MSDLAGSLTFAFDADISGFARATDSAGARLDALAKHSTSWASDTSRSMTQALGEGRPLDIVGSTGRSTGGDDDAGKELTRLSDQLALLQSIGAAHAAIAEQIRIEAAQAKLGSDATAAQTAEAASLVRQIDAAAASQKQFRTEQQATNSAIKFGSDQLTQGVEDLMLKGQSLNQVAASLLSNFARQGLSGALSGSGPLAGLFGTKGVDGAPGGLFGALGTLLTGGGAASAVSTGFSGLYASGGTIGAGQWGIAGEKGAEIVHGPATVTPWAKAIGQAAAPRSTQVIQFTQELKATYATKTDLSIVDDKVRKIQDNQGWVIKLIVGAVIVAVLGLVIAKGGVPRP